MWVRTGNGDLYPNMYTVLVAPPGVGKTVSLALTEKLWRDLEDQHVAPTSLTKAALIDSLNDAERGILVGKDLNKFNSLKVIAGELGAFLPSYENDFMNTLTHIYDGWPYAERRRGNDIHIAIDKPQLTILGATTPSYLKQFMPEGAWDQGFISRTMLIFAGVAERRGLFAETHTLGGHQYNDLLSDFNQIGSIYGRMDFTPQAASLFSDWHDQGGPPIPDHPKLKHYLTRRTAHALKMAMVSSASRGNSLIIDDKDFDFSINNITEAEFFMPDIFRSMGGSNDSKVMDETWHFIFERWGKEKRPVIYQRVVNFIAERVPSYNVLRMLEIMEKGGLIIRENGPKGEPVFRPGAKSNY